LWLEMHFEIDFGSLRHHNRKRKPVNSEFQYLCMKTNSKLSGLPSSGLI
jgi:hypothetical protein